MIVGARRCKRLDTPHLSGDPVIPTRWAVPMLISLSRAPRPGYSGRLGKDDSVKNPGLLGRYFERLPTSGDAWYKRVARLAF